MMKRRKFKLGQWLLVPINGEYKIKFLSNVMFDENCVSLYHINHICKNEIVYRWKPTKNEICFFVDFLGVPFVDKFIGIDEDNSFCGNGDYSYMPYSDYYHKSENSLKVANYCPCCAEKDPYIDVDTFEICEPYVGQKESYYKRFHNGFKKTYKKTTYY